MICGLMGKKVAMTQVFEDGSALVPVTVLEVGPCYVVAKRTDETGVCRRVQIGYGEDFSGVRPVAGHCAKSGLPPMKRLMEVGCDGDEIKLGDAVSAGIFTAGDKVDVIALSKGRGFTGVMKRHGFSGQPASHGGKAHRRPGSIGQASYPARVWKGIKMPGRAGGKRVTAQGLRVVSVDAARNIVAVKGSVPGRRGSEIFIRHSVKGGGQVAAG